MYGGQEATVRTGHGTTDWSKLGKEYVKAVYCHTAYLTYAEYIMQNAGLDEAQSGIKIAGRNINNLRYAEKAMVTHSSVLAWRVPGIGESGGLPSMGLHRVGHNLAVAATPIYDKKFSTELKT